jgi:hypothetical protein
VSAVEVPTELIERWVHNLTGALDYLDNGSLGAAEVRRLVGMVHADLRALLPQPVATCPNCGHQDADHAGDGCAHGADRGQLDCDCPFSPPAVVAVRRLIAAERDSVLMGGVR